MTVDVPRGTLPLWYAPPHEKYAILLALLAALYLLGTWGYERRFFMRERLPAEQ